MQNFANANAVLDQVRILIQYGITAEHILILTVYCGETKLVIHKIRSDVEVEGVTVDQLYSEVTTIDPYQGKKNEIVIVDIVAANPKAGLDANNVGGELQDVDEEAAIKLVEI